MHAMSDNHIPPGQSLLLLLLLLLTRVLSRDEVAVSDDTLPPVLISTLQISTQLTQPGLKQEGNILLRGGGRGERTAGRGKGSTAWSYEGGWLRRGTFHVTHSAHILSSRTA